MCRHQCAYPSAERDDVNRCALGLHQRQVCCELFVHNSWAANRLPDSRLVEDPPAIRWVVPVENILAAQASCYATVDHFRPSLRVALAEQRPHTRLRLKQPGNDAGPKLLDPGRSRLQLQAVIEPPRRVLPFDAPTAPGTTPRPERHIQLLRDRRQRKPFRRLRPVQVRLAVVDYVYRRSSDIRTS